jgi:predicted CXXCH cytochrome family protein
MNKTMTGMAMGLALVLAGGPAFAAISGSKHDFRATGGGTPITGVTELCKTCHVPHKPLMNVPLWAHALSTIQYNLYATNADYQGPNAAAYTASPTNLANTKARLCLSCHDGTVAVAGTTYVGAGNIMWDSGAAAAAASGLKGSHPIAVAYATVRTNQASDYADITGNADVKLDAGRVSCTSCHNVHNKTAIAKMLVKNNAGSALCTTCHTK